MLIRLCYASMRQNHENLLQDLSDILTTSRHFNPNHEIYGVLYYANNSFFQCLEGEEERVYALVDKIRKDKRHYNLFCFEHTEIESVSFKKWSMKYVEKDQHVDIFFKTKNFEYFQPLSLKQDEVNDLVGILLNSQETHFESSNQGYKNRGYYPYL